MARRKFASPPDLPTRVACVSLVVEAAKRHKVPAALIVSHSNHRVASLARKEVQKSMIEDLGMRRRWVAFMFSRDLRRVRASELGQKPDRKYCKKSSKFRHFRDILVPVGPQLVWVGYVNLPTVDQKRRAMLHRINAERSDAEIQLVLGFLSWRRAFPYGNPNHS